MYNTQDVIKSKMNVTAKGKRNQILRWLKLRGEWLYMDAFLEPIYQYRDTPITLHVGGCTEQPVSFIPVLFCFIADTKEANNIVGIKGAPNCPKRCRMCSSGELMRRTYKDTELWRVDGVNEMLQRRGQEAWIASMLGRRLTPGQLNSLK
jgi:hypothetical protein